MKPKFDLLTALAVFALLFASCTCSRENELLESIEQKTKKLIEKEIQIENMEREIDRVKSEIDRVKYEARANLEMAVKCQSKKKL